MKKSEIK
jgi:hypothetical protein